MSPKDKHNVAARKPRQDLKEKAIELEHCHYSYEHLLHLMFSDKDFHLHCRKEKQICVLSYCMYYYGITVQQLVATGITPASKPASELVFLNRLVREGVLEVEKSSVQDENINVYFLTRSGADFCEARLIALSDFPGMRDYIDKKVIHEIRKRFNAFTKPANISHFVSVRDLHAFLLSHVPDTNYHYQSEVGISYDGLVYDLHEKIMAVQTNRLHQGVAFLSDALFCRPAIMDGNPAFTLTDHKRLPGMAEYPDQTFYVYIEQDMSTQRLNIITGKLGAYVETVAAHAKHPALHTLLFCLQTRLTKSDLRTKQQDLTSPAEYTLPQATKDKQSLPVSMRYSSFRCNKPLPPLKRSAWRERDALIAVPGMCVIRFGDDWRDASIDSVAALCTEVSRCCDEYPQYYGNLARHLSEIVAESPELTIGEYIAYVWEMRRLSSTPDANPHTLRNNQFHSDRYQARRETIAHAVDAALELKKMFRRGFSVCTAPNRNLDSVIPFILPAVCFDSISIMQGFAINYFGMGEHRDDRPVYSSYAEDPVLPLAFRNRYLWKNGLCLYIENISDDFGGYARVKGYLDHMSWNGDAGILVCLVSDADNVVNSLCKCPYYTKTDMTVPSQNEAPYSYTHGQFPLRVVYVSYSMYPFSAGLYEIDSTGKKTNLQLSI